MSTARLFYLTLPKCKQTIRVAAFTCGELADILCIHHGLQGNALALCAWHPESQIFPAPEEIVREVKP